MNIKTVTILGANGTMGSQCTGIIAGFGNAKVFMIARSIDKANEGINNAIDSIKSDAIKDQLIPKTYEDIKECVEQSDWIFELTAEDIETKQNINKQISQFKKPKAIVSTVSSGLSIDELAKDFSKNEQKYYFGTHFFNPPYKMLLCELIPNSNSDLKIQKELFDYLQNILHRKVVITKNTPGFAGNRIGFQLLNEAILFAEKNKEKGNFSYIDKLLGGFTGRAMPPFATIDLVGLDVHKAIVENIYNLTNDFARDSFKLPKTIKDLILKGKLGNKTNGGFYTKESKKDIFNFDFIDQSKEKIAEGKYKEAYQILINTDTYESNIIQYFFARYISYSLSLVGSVVKTKEDIDKVMAYGFSWLPPCALVDLIGNKAVVIELLNKYKMPIPEIIIKHSSNKKFFTLQSELDFRSFIKAY
jgi:3-hydroxyacyl-CoA dehydrogenase